MDSKKINKFIWNEKKDSSPNNSWGICFFLQFFNNFLALLLCKSIFFISLKLLFF